MLKDRLDALKVSEGFRQGFLNAVSYLRTQGVISILREVGQPKQVSYDAPNFAENNIAINNWAIGYNAALNHLEDFLDIFLYPKTEKDSATVDLADYGARRTLVEQGILTEEEYKEITGR